MSNYLTDWLNFTTPFDKVSSSPEKCERFDSVGNENGEDSCAVANFDRSVNVNCNEYVYEDEEVTILNEVRFIVFKR